jgi:hypothetical protein
MVSVGFVVEGDSDVYLPKSPVFRDWVKNDFGIEVLSDVVNVGGNGNLCSRNIGDFVERFRIQKQPEKIVVLADLDPEECAPCIEQRKLLMSAGKVDAIIIARKAIESWFLADTAAMRRWSGDPDFYEHEPENLSGMPWDRLKEIGHKRGRGPGSKVIFARKFIRDFGFDIREAAQHPACPSAKYFLRKLQEL